MSTLPKPANHPAFTYAEAAYLLRVSQGTLFAWAGKGWIRRGFTGRRATNGKREVGPAMADVIAELLARRKGSGRIGR